MKISKHLPLSANKVISPFLMNFIFSLLCSSNLLDKNWFHFRCIFWLEDIDRNGSSTKVQLRPSLLDQSTRLSNNVHIGNPLKLSSIQMFKVSPGHRWEVTFTLNWALVNISLWFFSIEFILFCLLRNKFFWSFLVIWADLYWFLVTCFLALLYSLLWSALVICMRNSL